VTCTLFDDYQHESHRIIIEKSTGVVRLLTSDNRQASVRVDSDVEDGDEVRSSTTSSGKSLRLKLHYPRGREQTKPTPVSVSIWENQRWVAVPWTDADKLRGTERDLCDTPELLLLLQSLRSLLAVAPGQGVVVPLSQSRTPDGTARVVLTGSCGCRVVCLLITVIPPIHWCVDNLHPDACPCSAANGFWNLSCCCGWSTYCVVPCTRWYAWVLPLPSQDYTGAYEADDFSGHGRGALCAAAGFVRRAAYLVAPPPNGTQLEEVGSARFVLGMPAPG
jgi:hypothetical protein